MNITTAEHGDDYQGELKANFSSNIWYGANNTSLYQYLTNKFINTRRYPEINAESLKHKLAQKFNIKSDQLCITNGSIEGIYNIAQAFRNKKSLILKPTFSEYENACKQNCHKIETGSFDNLIIDIEKHQPDLVWICNPNNPAGQHIHSLILLNLIEKYKHTIFIIDQSYQEFCIEKSIEFNAISDFSNIILLHSFTKRYSIPGLRIGYIYSNKKLIEKISKYSIPWSVNSLAIEAAKFILDQDEDDFNLQKWLNESAKLQTAINSIGIFECRSSSTPFFSVKLLAGKANNLKSYLLNESILIRDANNIYQNQEENIRLISLSAEENELLITKLVAWKQQL